MQHLIKNVEALYPRVNTTYKFDSQEMKSVKCDPSDPAAVYETSFRMTSDQAKELWKEMTKAYAERKQAGWPDKPNNPLRKEDDTGCYIGKAKLKGNYNGELTKGVPQYDAKNNKLDDEFLLTSGSKINLAVTFVPYNMREAGVSMRLRAIQVVEYREMAEAPNPFDTVADGYTAQPATPFTAAPAAPSKPDAPFSFDDGDAIPF